MAVEPEIKTGRGGPGTTVGAAGLSPPAVCDKLGPWLPGCSGSSPDSLGGFVGLPISLLLCRYQGVDSLRLTATFSVAVLLLIQQIQWYDVVGRVFQTRG
ncbi:MAG: hypothetical protein IMX01_01195 [Limnochordaceae bacterium]|nr:hypothetical protein [Limnochordaceae bacterium]